MKTLLAVAVAGITGFAAAYIIVSVKKNAELARQREALTGAASVSEAVRSVDRGIGRPDFSGSRPAPVVESGGSAAEILEKLKGFRVDQGPRRYATTRQIIHQLERLVDLGPAALPPIREFLARFEDVDYLVESSREEDGFDSGNPSAERIEFRTGLRGQTSAQRRLPRLEFAVPPSLRLGLVDVLKGIGGEEAERILAEMLGKTGRGVEVAYVARALQEMAPNEYRDVAIGVAKELLANMPTVERPNRLDENARGYLYTVLDLYGDTTFASNAQSLLIAGDGSVDRTALTYVTTTLKEQAVPALYQAYKDPRITNFSERVTLASQILSYTGTNSHANDVFREIVADNSLPSWMRSLTIQSLAGGRGPIPIPAPTDSAQIRARLDLLAALPDYGDERMALARNEAIEKLNNRLTTVEAAENAKTFRDRAIPAGLPGGAAPLP